MENHITQKALEEVDKQYRMLFEKSNDAIVITTPKGKILDINPAGLQLFGYARKEDVLEIDIDIAEHYYAWPEDRTVFRKVLEIQGSVSDYELQLKKKSGKIFTALVTSNLCKNGKAEVIIQSIIRNVSEQRRLQQQPLQEQKLEAVGQLAGGMAHNMNNILSAITGYGYLIKMQLSSDDPVRADVEQILEAAHRAGDLTRSLSGFSLGRTINPVLININELIIKAVELLSWLTGDDIEVVTRLENTEISCMVDAAQIEQVLINLATNARDAMPKGGRLSVKTEVAQFDDDFIASHGFGKPGTYVLISVSDTGTGMDQKAVSNIFEPFHTMNETGKVTVSAARTIGRSAAGMWPRTARIRSRLVHSVSERARRPASAGRTRTTRRSSGTRTRSMSPCSSIRSMIPVAFDSETPSSSASRLIGHLAVMLEQPQDVHLAHAHVALDQPAHRGAAELADPATDFCQDGLDVGGFVRGLSVILRIR